MHTFSTEKIQIQTVQNNENIHIYGIGVKCNKSAPLTQFGFMCTYTFSQSKQNYQINNVFLQNKKNKDITIFTEYFDSDLKIVEVKLY